MVHKEKKKKRKQFTGAKTKAEFAAKDARLKRERERKKKGISRREGNIEERKLRGEQKKQPVEVPKQPDVIKLTEDPKFTRAREEEVARGEKVKKGLIIAGGAASLAIPGGLAVRAGLTAAKIGFAAGRSLLLKRATGKAIQAGFKQQAAATAGIAKTAVRNPISLAPTLGKMTINQKTIGLTKSFLTKTFGVKIMAIGGAWASSVFLGRWGQAEAPEAIMIPIRDLIKLAETPEDWEVINEHLELAEKLSDTAIWEEIILWSPFSAVKGIMDKVRGVADGVKILGETAEKIQEIQQKEEEQGESEFAKERRESDEAAFERKREFGEEETARFEEIDKEREEAREERAKEETERFAKIDEERQAAKERETLILQEVFRLRRAGKFDEADELELTIFQ